MPKNLIAIFLFNIITLHAQTGGEDTFLFLNIPTNARQIALGGKTLTLSDDVNQPKWNPATINVDMHKQLSVNYSSYLAGISIGSISYAHRVNSHSKTIYSNISYINYGTLIRADAEGSENGIFNASDIAFSGGYAYTIPNSDIHVGSNLKFIHSTIDSFSSSALAFDIGAFYFNTNRPYRLAFVLRNIGFQLNSYNGIKESLPFEIAISGSYQLENVPLRWYLTIDNLQKWHIAVPNPSNSTSDLDGEITPENISFFNNAIRHFIIGAELFPEKAINLRIGYNFKRGKELQLRNIRNFGGLSFGFGLKMNKIRLAYAYSKYHNATNSNTFTLTVDLNQ